MSFINVTVDEKVELIVEVKKSLRAVASAVDSVPKTGDHILIFRVISLIIFVISLMRAVGLTCALDISMTPAANIGMATERTVC